MATGEAKGDDAPPERFDPYAHLHAAGAAPRSVKALPALLRGAVVLARRASPRLFALVVGCQVLTAVLLGVQVVLGKLAIQAVLEQAGDDAGRIGPAIAPLVALAVASAVSGLIGSAQTQLQRMLGEAVQRETWTAILGVTTTVPLADFESPAFFDDLQRVRVNALLRPLTVVTGLVQVLAGLLAVIGLGITLVVIQPLLLLVLLLGGGPLAWISRKAGRIEFAFTVRQTGDQRLRHYLETLLTGRDEAKEVRAFDLGGTLEARWERSFATYFAELSHHVRRRIGLSAAAALITALSSSAALAILVWYAVDGRIALGTAAAALLAIRLFAGRAQQLFGGISGLFESSLFLRDLDAFLARAPDPAVLAAARTGADPGPFAGLRAEDVRFRYPGARRDALQGVSIEIGAGEVVALVGENGSGKTTLAKVLAQLLAPTGGAVRWNGTDTATLDPVALRRQVGVIFQDFVRYQLTARENVGLSRPEALGDLGAIRAAARLGGADAQLAGLPDGYETVLGKEFRGGHDLSGGQWQRVALARAFFRDAALLVLDEPTAALDARSEHEVFEHVRRLAEGRSVLLISHRFSTVRSADRIYVLEEGRVLEHGSHAELMAHDGRYAELFELQASSYR